MRSFTPRSMEEYAAALAEFTPQSKIVSGGTDFAIALRHGKFAPDILLSPTRVPELREIELTQTRLRIGAMVCMADIADKLVQVPEFRAIADAAANVGTPQIRNRATVAGNLCNASPAGDMLPIAWLYGAELELLCADGTYENIPAEQFILGPQKNALKPQQAVTGILFDRNRCAGFRSAFRKVGFRSYVSIARESMGMLLRLSEDGTVAQAYIALGAVGSTPIRALEAEELMRGHVLDNALRQAVTESVAATIQANCRPANRLYKTEAARGLVADVLAAFDRATI